MLLNNVNKYFSAIKNRVLNVDEKTQPEAVEITLQENIITGLSMQKKEMIATYVSYLHDAFFGQGNALQNHAFHEYAGQPMPVKLKALIGIASTYAKSIGATEQEIHDTVLVPSVFCSYQRSVDVVVSNKSIAEKTEPRTYTTPVISLQDRKKETA